MFGRKPVVVNNPMPCVREVNTTIHEHRAPTDESIKYYGEFKEKAYQGVLDTLEVNTNSFSFRAIIYEEHSSFKYIFEYDFYLNNERFSGKVSTTASPYNNYEEWYAEFMKEVLEDVARTMAKPLLEAFHKCISRKGVALNYNMEK